MTAAMAVRATRSAGYAAVELFFLTVFFISAQEPDVDYGVGE
jgi:hypothetical protein